jgi:hypothetical protein
MYIGYVKDRKSMGFKCYNDNNLFQLKYLHIFFATLILFPGKQINSSDFSKYSDVSIYQFVNQNQLDLDKESSEFLNFTLDLSGGAEECGEDYISSLLRDENRLINSIINKKVSINKFFKNIFETLEPIIIDNRFWVLLNEPRLKSGLNMNIDVNSTQILVKNKPKRKISLVVEGFRMELNLNKNKNFLLVKERSFLKMVRDDFERFNKSEPFIKTANDVFMTRIRRQEPVIASTILGDKFFYSVEQCYNKGRKHLPDFKIKTDNMSPVDISMRYIEMHENFLDRSETIRRDDGTFSNSERTINFGNKAMSAVSGFEIDVVSGLYFFISFYTVSLDNYLDFEETGNIGLSKYQRESRNYQNSRNSSETNDIILPASFFKNLPNNAKMSLRQIRDAQLLEAQVKNNPNVYIYANSNQRELLSRYEKYKRELELFQRNKHDG